MKYEKKEFEQIKKLYIAPFMYNGTIYLRMVL